MSLVVGKRRHNNNWKTLCSILNYFGIAKSMDKIKLFWEVPDDNQFDFLLKLMSQLTNTNLKGSYSNNTKEWVISP